MVQKNGYFLQKYSTILSLFSQNSFKERIFFFIYFKRQGFIKKFELIYVCTLHQALVKNGKFWKKLKFLSINKKNVTRAFLNLSTIVHQKMDLERFDTKLLPARPKTNAGEQIS